MNFRFLHAADLHLDTPFQGVARISPELRETLTDASLNALDRLVEAALHHEVRFVVLAGDLYDGAERGVRAQLRMHAALSRLSDAGIDTFIAHGNHDPVHEGWSAIRSWPERVHIFPHDQVETVRLDVQGRLVTVSGISYPRRDVSENLALRFVRPAEPGFHVAVLHANVGSRGEHANYCPCTFDELVASGFDYWALGHIHKRQVLRAEKPAIVYPGNTQGRSFKPSEQGAKGAYVVTVEDGRVGLEFIELGAVRFEEVTVSASALDDLAALTDALEEAAESVRTPAGELLVRGRVTGASSLYDDLVRPETQPDMLRELIERTSRTSGLWWTALHFEVQPERNLDDIAERDDLLGEIVRQGLGHRANLESLRARIRRERAVGTAVEQMTDVDLLELIERATALAVELAAREG